jgi:hypothetical protein
MLSGKKGCLLLFPDSFLKFRVLARLHYQLLHRRHKSAGSLFTRPAGMKCGGKLVLGIDGKQLPVID